MVKRGKSPSCTAWRESEKTPVINACEAITVASVAETINTTSTV